MHEEKVHLQAGKQRAVTQPRGAAESVWARVVNDLGSFAGQGVDREASKGARRSIWRKRRGQGQSVYARDKEN